MTLATNLQYGTIKKRRLDFMQKYDFSFLNNGYSHFYCSVTLTLNALSLISAKLQSGYGM